MLPSCRAFEWTPPEWVHLPVITRDGKKKLSKRDADAYVGYYREELGMAPIALLNYLVGFISAFKFLAEKR